MTMYEELYIFVKRSLYKNVSKRLFPHKQNSKKGLSVIFIMLYLLTEAGTHEGFREPPKGRIKQTQW